MSAVLFKLRITLLRITPVRDDELSRGVSSFSKLQNCSRSLHQQRDGKGLQKIRERVFEQQMAALAVGA